MGRRSINTTKSGKYMNPTDQHRKEARKRELRKNKKQRLLVRTAVLKGKDPYQIIADMERLDQMEYNVNTPPPLNEKVLKDKRRKMKETWDRLCRLYVKDDHQRFLELKRMEADYEYKRNQMMKFYEAVKSAQEVTVDDIPLPSAPMDPKIGASTIQIPSFEPPVPQSILKRPTLPLAQLKNKSPPGVPPGPPPVLSDIEDDLEEDSEEEKDTNKKLRFSDETPEKDSDVNEFLKEIEQMEKTANSSNENMAQTIQSIQTSLAALSSNQTSSSVPNQSSMAPPMPPKGVPGGPPPQMMMFRAVPPPAGLRATSSSTIPGLIVGRSGMPTGPPGLRPGLPPRMLGPRPMMPPMRSMGPPMPPSGMPSNLNKSGEKKSHFVTERATIEAKPQLRNLSADATRFTPVALRVKREDKGVKRVNPKTGFDSEYGRRSANPNQSLNAPTKDDAYDQFMKEMSSII